jgi:hypothetical protein
MVTYRHYRTFCDVEKAYFKEHMLRMKRNDQDVMPRSVCDEARAWLREFHSDWLRVNVPLHHQTRWIMIRRRNLLRKVFVVTRCPQYTNRNGVPTPVGEPNSSSVIRTRQTNQYWNSTRDADAYRAYNSAREHNCLRNLRIQERAVVHAAAQPQNLIGSNTIQDLNLKINFETQDHTHGRRNGAELMEEQFSLCHATPLDPMEDFQLVKTPGGGPTEYLPRGTLGGRSHLRVRPAADDLHSEKVWANGSWVSMLTHADNHLDLGIVRNRLDHWVGIVTATNPDYHQFSQHHLVNNGCPNKQKTFLKSHFPVTVSVWFKGVFAADNEKADYTLCWVNPIHG